MIKEAEDNSELDAVRLAEENKIWKARDKVLQDREVRATRFIDI